MTKQEDSYWLQIGIEEFSKQVWQRGLDKFALDQSPDSAPDVFICSDYSITVNRQDDTQISLCLTQRTEAMDIIVVLLYYIEYPDMPPLISAPENILAIQLLEDVSALWTENLFSLRAG